LLVLDPHPAATSPAAPRAIAMCRPRNRIIVSALGMIGETYPFARASPEDRRGSETSS
jgi:hypothetical protein